MAKIIFLLPGRARTPVGGYKVVFEYANRLAADGYKTEVVYPAMLPDRAFSPSRTIRAYLRYLKILIKKDYSCSSWFALDGRVRERWIPKFSRHLFSAGDIVVATACETAFFLLDPRIGGVRKHYLIQHYENWVDKDMLDATWKSNLTKAVIADWLGEIGQQYGTKTTLIENGLDFKTFGITTPIAKKNEFSITMLWHKAENKGSLDGFKAISIAREKYPEIEAHFFGIPERPESLPEWVRYYRKPSAETLRELYNRSAVFIAPSLSEGFGLTAAEAMQCGCAVASTDAGGFLQFCKDGTTALVSPAGKPEILARNILRLVENDEERIAIAQNGNRFIADFTWERAYKKMKAFLELES